MEVWHVSKGEVVIGPIAEEMFVQRIRAGEFSKGSLVWKKGLKTWEPIEVHFPDEVMASTGNHTPSALFPSANLIAAHAQSGPNHGNAFRRFWASGAVTFATFVLFFCVDQYAGDLEGPAAFVGIWGGSLMLAIVSGIITTRKLWSYGSQRAAVSAGIEGGVAKLIAVASGVSLLVFAIFYLSQGSLIYRVEQARKVYDKYTMEVDPVGNEIIINGTIGPSFADQLEHKLFIHSGIESIVITSPGGLVDEGLKAARVIERKGNLSVIARQTCNSACLLMLMAGNQRYADWDMDLGFHAVSAITHVDEQAIHLAELGAEADSYLSIRGVPKEIIAGANAKGAKSMESVPAIKMAELKVLSGLLDGNKIVNPSTAKWRSVEDKIGKSQDEEVLSFAPILAVIRETSSPTVEKYADMLYSAFEAYDSKTIQSAVRGVVSDIVPRAMKAADGPELYDYTLSNLKQVEYLKSMEQWTTCAAYLNGKVGSDINVMSRAAFKAELRSLEKLIRSAAAKGWKEQPIPGWAVREGETIAQGAAAAASDAGIDLDKLESNPRNLCILTYALIKLITDEGIDRAPPILRWLNQQAD